MRIIRPFCGDNRGGIFLKISPTLSTDSKEKLAKLLTINPDLFAWKPEGIPGINPDIISHELNVHYTRKPIQQ